MGRLGSVSVFILIVLAVKTDCFFVDDSSCLQFPDFKSLLSKTISQHACFSVNEALVSLDGIFNQDKRCGRDVIRYIKDLRDHVRTCYRDSPAYKAMFDLYFYDADRFHHTHSTHKTAPHPTVPVDCGDRKRDCDSKRAVQPGTCTSHVSLWGMLDSITMEGRNDCLLDMIRHLKYSFDASGSGCVCSGPSSSNHSHHLPSTAAPPSTPAVKAINLSTMYGCDQHSVIHDIAKGEHVDVPGSTTCDPVAHGSSEDYVLATCNVTKQFIAWTRGPKLSAYCRDAQLPMFVPIATFKANDVIYHPPGAQSGILLRCLSDGFEMAVQHCRQPPEIIAIHSGGAFNNDPDQYYLVA